MFIPSEQAVNELFRGCLITIFVALLIALGIGVGVGYYVSKKVNQTPQVVRSHK